MAKLKLDISGMADAFFEDTVLLGISNTLPPHRFVWMVNKHFGMDFRYQPEQELELEHKGRSYYYPIYRHAEKLVDAEHLLYTNLYDGEPLMPELNHTDFLWLIRGEAGNPTMLGQLEQELRQLQGTRMVTRLAQDKLRHKMNLVF